MGWQASVDIEFHERLSTLENLSVLLESGWGFEPAGVITHLPLHDNGMFDWQDAPAREWPTIRSLIQQKVQERELVGVDLLWKDTLVGGSFLFYPEPTVSIGLMGNRPRLDRCGPLTDMSWFLVRVIPPLLSAGNVVGSVCCRDIST